MVDRESYSIELESPNGRSIDKTLAMLDLFSFDVPGGSRMRRNFETLFQKYEANIEDLTKGLLAKPNSRSGDIKAEIIDLFAPKLLNCFRNAYSIEKVLNTFPNFASPTDPALLASYRQIVNGRKPHQACLCSQLGISDQQYDEWLRVLFMLLMQTGESRHNRFEGIIKGLMEDRKKQVFAHVWEYDNDRCLLSDRGSCQPIADGEHMALSFNLCSAAFIDYIFADARTLVQDRASPEFLAHTLASFERRPQVTVHVTLKRNDRDMLARYNRGVIEQCYERVYCSAKDGLVLS